MDFALCVANFLNVIRNSPRSWVKTLLTEEPRSTNREHLSFLPLLELPHCIVLWLLFGALTSKPLGRTSVRLYSVAASHSISLFSFLKRKKFFLDAKKIFLKQFFFTCYNNKRILPRDLLPKVRNTCRENTRIGSSLRNSLVVFFAKHRCDFNRTYGCGACISCPRYNKAVVLRNFFCNRRTLNFARN